MEAILKIKYRFLFTQVLNITANFFSIWLMTHILRTITEHKTASLADEGNSAYRQSSGAHNIKHI